MKTLHDSLKTAGTAFLALVALFGAGCFVATYPETVDASDFEEFEYRGDYPLCVDIPSTSDQGFGGTFVCEATIIRASTGEYLVQLTIPTYDPPALTGLPQRMMTSEEAEHFLVLSRELHISRHPWPYCNIPVQIAPKYEVFLRWDELELVFINCDRARLDEGQVDAIERFLNTLLPDEDAASP
ncbi:MAG: hypothetical protein J5J06_04570 [Phycisphaerae bacterium]|nr:hypothetical protein [Phycisphaerae bacterium]